MQTYRLAIVGFGGMGSWHAENIMQKVPDIEVAGAYDIRGEAMDKVRRLGLKAYDSFEALISDPRVDIVTVATPNDSHKRLAIAALEAGKHVICEKPVTLNAAELLEILAVRDATGKLFSVHQNRRWDKDFRIVQEAYRQGLLGKLTFVDSKVQGSRKAMHGWRGYRQNGGGMLLDWGVHLLDQAMQLIDEPVTEVGAHLLSVYTREVDDNIRLYLRFAGGASVQLEMSTNCLINEPRWHVQGTEGTLRIDDWSGAGKLLQLKQNAQMEWTDDIVYTAAGPTRTMAPRPAFTMTEVPLPAVKSDWSEYYRNIADTLGGKATLIVKPEQALRVMRVIDLLFLASREGRGQKCEI
jgi:scyllo-inositol 2-dehydrogenase (NADP+)